MAKKANVAIIPNADGCFCKRLLYKALFHNGVAKKDPSQTPHQLVIHLLAVSRGYVFILIGDAFENEYFQVYFEF